MHIGIRAAAAAAAASCLVVQAAAAQVAASPTTDAPPVNAAPAPLVVWVAHPKPPNLSLLTPGDALSVALGGGALGGALRQGVPSSRQLIKDDDIRDPSGEMAREIAVAYAAAHGGRLVEAPIIDEHARSAPDTLASRSNGARYIVDAQPSDMLLSYYNLEFKHYDMQFLDAVRIVDTSNGKVIERAHCVAGMQKKTPQSPTLEQLLADKAAGLKALIASKAESCVAKMEADLKLTSAAAEPRPVKASN